MELVEGETLADRIARGPIPWREAVTIFEAIADGLKAAHESGIVHRDLKPANVKIDEQGRVKVLDFGLARTAAGDEAGVVRVLSHSPTLVAPATVEGVLLGTAGYMSRKARGLRVDRRADVWAFGCCLYEALSGARAFDGEDISLILVAILSREPEWERLPADLPPGLTTLLRRCLEKDPAPAHAGPRRRALVARRGPPGPRDARETHLERRGRSEDRRDGADRRSAAGWRRHVVRIATARWRVRRERGQCSERALRSDAARVARVRPHQRPRLRRRSERNGVRVHRFVDRDLPSRSS